MKSYIEIPEAQQLITGALPRLGAEEIACDVALGRLLASDLFARDNLPRFDNSSMDGFAVRRTEVAGASPESPVTLDLAGEIAAGGFPDDKWPTGACLRILTGAPVPQGADGVIPVEETSEVAGGRIRFTADLARTGDNLRATGQDVRIGDLLLEKGARITPPVLGLLAGQGITSLSVRKLPRVGFLATGNELVTADQDPGPGQIRNSNSPLIVSQFQAAGFPVRDLGVALDTPDALREALTVALADDTLDVLVSSGGVSMGRYDLVGDILAELGAEWIFHKIAQKPGKPLAFLKRGDKPIFGLPGNPVSSFMCTWYYVIPALKRMMGDARPDPLHLSARLTATIAAQPPRFFFARARTTLCDGVFRTEPVGLQESHALQSLTRANSFILLPATAGVLSVGTEVEVALFDTL
ncbi:MAG: molybdopterin molybdotransferase MoeA [bacterium]|nr:molybdopterin molybdotransferase MoeA [bacterium]